MSVNVPQRPGIHGITRGSNHERPSGSNLVDDAASQDARRSKQAVQNDIGLVNDTNQLRLLATSTQAGDGEIRSRIAEQHEADNDGLNKGPMHTRLSTQVSNPGLRDGSQDEVGGNARVVSPGGKTLMLWLRLDDGDFILFRGHDEDAEEGLHRVEIASPFCLPQLLVGDDEEEGLEEERKGKEGR